MRMHRRRIGIDPIDEYQYRQALGQMGVGCVKHPFHQEKKKCLTYWPEEKAVEDAA